MNLLSARLRFVRPDRWVWYCSMVKCLTEIIHIVLSEKFNLTNQIHEQLLLSWILWEAARNVSLIFPNHLVTEDKANKPDLVYITFTGATFLVS